MSATGAQLKQSNLADETSSALPTTAQASLIGNDIFRNPAFGNYHPLSKSGHSDVWEMCNILGWIKPETYHDCEPAADSQLRQFHDRDYLLALRAAVKKGRVEVTDRERYAIGTMENPIFPGLYQRAACTVGGAVLAAQLAMRGAPAFHPAGGTHHGRSDRASGFCYFNDPVFAIRSFLDAGIERVFYIDLDAHHGDGVQDAYAEDARVYTVSIHEADRWPYSGPVEDRGGGQARNLAVPAGLNDSELQWMMEHAVLPLMQRFQPRAMVMTCGADALHGDPLSRMELSNVALWRAIEDLIAVCPRAAVLGGGGYNPWTVVRYWTGLWGRLSGYELPSVLPPEARSLLAGLECDLVDEEEVEPAWLTTLTDEPRNGPVRTAVKNVAAAMMT